MAGPVRQLSSRSGLIAALLASRMLKRGSTGIRFMLRQCSAACSDTRFSGSTISSHEMSRPNGST